MPRLARKGVLAIVALSAGLVGTLIGCADKENPDLATPTSTIQKYLAIANRLVAAKEIDIGSVREGVQCFSKDDRDWFRNNYKTFHMGEITENASMAISEPAIRQAFVFMQGVVPRGPHGDGKQVSVVSETATEASVKVDEYFTIPLVKEGPNWRIKGLFGRDAVA